MTKTDVEKYEQVQMLLLKLYLYFKDECHYDVKVTYMQSYAQYFKLSQISEVWVEWITDKENKKGVWLSGGVMMTEPDNNQYVLHISCSYRYTLHLDHIDFDTILNILKEYHVMPYQYIPTSLAEIFNFI